jgi:hypothetical protein
MKEKITFPESSSVQTRFVSKCVLFEHPGIPSLNPVDSILDAWEEGFWAIPNMADKELKQVCIDELQIHRAEWIQLLSTP